MLDRTPPSVPVRAGSDDGDKTYCPLCYRDLPRSAALCPSCFDNLPAVAEEKRLRTMERGYAGPEAAVALAARFMVLDREAVEEAANDRRYAPIGAIVTGIGIAGSLAPTTFGLSSLFALTAFKYLAVYLPAVIFTHALARMMGGQGSYPQLLRAFHLTNLAYGVGLIPVVGPVLLSVVALWDLVVSTYVLMVVHKISACKAIWVQVATIMALIGACMAFPLLGL